MKRTVFFSLLLAALIPHSAFALEIPKRLEGRVSDYAGMLSPNVRAGLEETLRRFEETTSNQVVVVTFPSLEGEVLEDFSIRLAEAWKIGQKGKDNGVILLIFKNDRKVRIEVGYGLEGALPDAVSKLILSNEITPRFREGKFDEGVMAAVEAVMAATQGEYRPASKSSALGLYAFFLGILPFLFYFLIGRGFRGPMVLGSRRSPRSGVFWGGGSFGGGDFGGGGFGGGGGGFGGGGASGGW